MIGKKAVDVGMQAVDIVGMQVVDIVGMKTDVGAVGRKAVETLRAGVYDTEFVKVIADKIELVDIEVVAVGIVIAFVKEETDNIVVLLRRLLDSLPQHQLIRIDAFEALSMMLLNAG